jgi:hypothetical protein
MVSCHVTLIESVSKIDVQISTCHNLKSEALKLFFSPSPYTVHCPNREPRQSGRLTPNKTETPLITQSRHYTNPYFHLSKWNRNSDSVLCWLGVTWPQPYFSILAKIFPICYGNFSCCYDGKLQELKIPLPPNFKELVSFRVTKRKIAITDRIYFAMIEKRGPGRSNFCTQTCVFHDRVNYWQQFFSYIFCTYMEFTWKSYIDSSKGLCSNLIS